MSQELCPCGSGRAYSECCGLFHSEKAYPETAEALMRSRYSAFVMKNEEYLLITWDESTRPQRIDFEEDMQWIELKINGRKKGRKKDREGWVTFTASYQLAPQGAAISMQKPEVGVLHETSYFRRNQQGNWVYVGGEIK